MCIDSLSLHAYTWSCHAPKPLLPLYHKSSRLCWGRPLAVSDAFGDDFFEILSVFWVEIHSSFFFLSTTLHYLAASKKVVRPKMAIFRPLSRGGWVGAL